MQQNKGNIESGQRQPEVPVDEAWSMMNELLDANLPVQEFDRKGFIIPRRVVTIFKVLGAVGCAAATFVSFHHWVAPEWSFNEPKSSIEIHADGLHPFKHSQLPVDEVNADRLSSVSPKMVSEFAKNELVVEATETSSQNQVSEIINKDVLDDKAEEKTSALTDFQLNNKDVVVAYNQLVADNQSIAMVDSVVGEIDQVSKPINVNDSLAIAVNTSMQKPVENLVVHAKAQGSMPRWAAGLQIPILIPTQGTDIYFMQTNGKKQPIMNFIPEIWMSTRVAPMQEVVLTFSPYKKYSTGDLVVDEVYRAAEIPKHRHENMMTQSKLVLTSGVRVDVSYRYGINSNWQVGMGLGYTRISKALLEEATYTDSIPSSSDRVYRSINAGAEEWKYVNPNQFTAQLELLYNYQRWSLGTSVQVPLNQFVESDYRQVAPVNWELMLRFALLRKS